jgi:hypothetical protein
MSAESELEADPKTVPKNVRLQVIDRDASCCRVCGQYVEHPALHHILYRSQGGKNTADNLIVVGWVPWHDCHLNVVHRNKRLWQPLLKLVVANPGTTAFQWRRWQTHS